jgi:hypothetical protein
LVAGRTIDLAADEQADIRWEIRAPACLQPVEGVSGSFIGLLPGRVEVYARRGELVERCVVTVEAPEVPIAKGSATLDRELVWLAPGESMEFHLVVGGEDRSALALWSIEGRRQVLRSRAGGRVDARQPGVVVLTARYGEASASAVVFVLPSEEAQRQATSEPVIETPVVLAPGDRVPLRLRWGQGDFAALTRWSVEPAAAVEFAASDEGFVVIARSAGLITLRGQIAGRMIERRCAVIGENRELALIVEPADAVLAVGEALHFRVFASSRAGDRVEVTEAALARADGAAIEPRKPGEVVALRPGRARLRLLVGEQIAELPIEVR